MASRKRKIITFIKEVMVPLFSMDHEQDEIFLASGDHELVVETNYVPTKVWFTFTEQEGIPVCGGNVDKLGITLLPKGFVISAQIHSDVRGIRWLAILDKSLPIPGGGPYGDGREMAPPLSLDGEFAEEDEELTEEESE